MAPHDIPPAGSCKTEHFDRENLGYLPHLSNWRGEKASEKLVIRLLPVQSAGGQCGCSEDAPNAGEDGPAIAGRPHAIARQRVRRRKRAGFRQKDWNEIEPTGLEPATSSLQS